MGRPRYPKHDAPLPPPLPPEDRTVGQLVAETLRLYGARFFAILPLGIVVAASDLLAVDRTLAQRSLILFAFAPAFSAAYAYAASIVTGTALAPGALVGSILVGSVVFAPAAAVFPWFALAALAWLALVGHVVPVLVVERPPLVAALRRGLALGRADYVHAIGGLATLVILFGLTRLVLALLLRSQAENTVQAAIFLADVVLSPTLFVGAALLYVDQDARLRLGTRRARRRAA